MNINSGIKQAVILTIGIIMLGFCIKSGQQQGEHVYPAHQAQRQAIHQVVHHV